MIWFSFLAGIAATLLVSSLFLSAVVALAAWQDKRAERARIAEEQWEAVQEASRLVKHR